MYWVGIKDGDPRAVALYRRHYSCRNPNVDYCRYGFSGKGESMILLTLDCKALWCWRLVKGDAVYCSVFHNESNILSSELISEADDLAFQRWPNVLHRTYVNARKIKSTNPGTCFIKAGWVRLKECTGKGLVILEKRCSQEVMELNI